MTHTLTTFFAAVALLGSVAATTVFAQETKPSPQSLQNENTMRDHHGMMNRMGQMSPDQKQQMTKMVENCNRMMESMSAPTGRDSDQKPATP